MVTNIKATLTKKTQLTRNVFLFSFDLIDPAAFEFLAGQYLILDVPLENTTIKRLYSIASHPGKKGGFDLVIQLIDGGVASAYLASLLPGAVAKFQGPAGLFVFRDNNHPKVFMVTGTGIAPIWSMINTHLASSPTKLWRLFWGLPHFEDVYYLEELKRLRQTYPDFSFRICLSQEKDLTKIAPADQEFFNVGRVNCGFKDLIIDNSDFYLCGSREVVGSLHDFVLSTGASRDHIFFEKF